MNEKAKSRVFTIATIIIAGIVLWFLLRDNKPVENVIVKSDPLVMAFPDSNTIGALDLPPLSYTPGNVNYVGGAKGCLLCYSGYQRLEPPSQPAVPMSTGPDIYNFIYSQPLNYQPSGGLRSRA